MADLSNSTPVPAEGMGFTALSSLFRDPALRHAFKRSENDDGAAFAVPPSPSRPLIDGAAMTRDQIEHTIEDRIARLDAMDGDADLEVTQEDDEETWDREDADDNGIADPSGLDEQLTRARRNRSGRRLEMADA